MFLNRGSCGCRRKWPVTQHSDANIQSNRELAFLLVLVLTWGGIASGKYSGGAGTSVSPYLISTPNDLSQIGLNPSDWNKNFKLTSDINMSAYNAADPNKSFRPIGYLHWEPYASMPFKGVFDGNNKQILNLNLTGDSNDFVGLFGYVLGNTALIRDLTLINPKVKAETSMYVGAVAGKLKSGNILRCKVKAGVINGADCTGGLVGYNTLGLISNCDANAIVSGKHDVGGIAGYHGAAKLLKSSFSGEVTGQTDVGGLVGESDGAITDCYSQAVVTSSSDEVGGLVGTSRGQINCSFTKSRVNGLNNIGGLVGRNIGLVQDSYALATVTGNYYVGGLDGLLYGEGIVSRCYAVCDVETNESPSGLFIGLMDAGTVSATFWTPKDTRNENMTRQSTYTAAGWDFVDENTNGTQDLWEICEGTDYPRLTWEKLTPGDFICPEGVDLSDFVVLFDLWLTEPVRTDITGDGIVNFLDYAKLSAAWKTNPGMNKWNAKCDVWPQDGGDGVVDFGDLAALASHWLGPGAGLGDIAPDNAGDGIVNFLDFALAAKYFLIQNQ